MTDRTEQVRGDSVEIAWLIKLYNCFSAMKLMNLLCDARMVLTMRN